MTLDEFMRDRGLTDTALAEALSVAQSSISRWRRGESFPRREALRRLVEFSGGAVSANELLETRRK